GSPPATWYGCSTSAAPSRRRPSSRRHDGRRGGGADGLLARQEPRPAHRQRHQPAGFCRLRQRAHVLRYGGGGDEGDRGGGRRLMERQMANGLSESILADVAQAATTASKSPQRGKGDPVPRCGRGLILGVPSRGGLRRCRNGWASDGDWCVG